MNQTLTDRAMLVTVNIRQWSGAKTDKRITQEVADTHGIKQDMGHYRKKLLGKDALGEIKRLAGELRNTHYARTLPWSDEGYRILSSAGYFQYSQEFNKLKNEFDEAVSKFVAGYPDFIESARRVLNGTFDPLDYPTEREIAERFGVSLVIRPMPTAGDFRVELGDAETARIKYEIETQVKLAINAAQKDVWDRLQKTIGHMADRLRLYSKVDGKVQNTFHDTLVSNLTDLLDVLPSLNLTGDANLSAMADRIKADLLTYRVAGQEFPVNTQVLKDDSIIRERVASKAEEILNQMGAYIA